jgi:toxin ParE1/3/4
MPTIVQTRQSRIDVVDILLYIRGVRPRAARRVHAAIGETLQFLAEYPGAGQERSELADRLRSLPVRRYRNFVVFYRPTHDGIEVIRVLHGARDLRRIFGRS